MSQIIDRILSDDTIKFNDAIHLLKNELQEYSYFEQEEIKEDLDHAFNYKYWDFK